jgi:hypothetical protein
MFLPLSISTLQLGGLFCLEFRGPIVESTIWQLVVCLDNFAVPLRASSYKFLVSHRVCAQHWGPIASLFYQTCVDETVCYFKFMVQRAILVPLKQSFHFLTPGCTHICSLNDHPNFTPAGQKKLVHE